MITDKQTILSGSFDAAGNRSAQAITATAISTNVLDRAGNLLQFPTIEDEGLAEGPWLIVQTDEAFNNLTSLQIDLISDSTAALTAAPVVHFTKTVLLAGLTASTRLIATRLPSDDYKRYIGVKYTVTGTAPTTGKVYAFMSMDLPKNNHYPTGFSIDA